LKSAKNTGTVVRSLFQCPPFKLIFFAEEGLERNFCYQLLYRLKRAKKYGSRCSMWSQGHSFFHTPFSVASHKTHRYILISKRYILKLYYGL